MALGGFLIEVGGVAVQWIALALFPELAFAVSRGLRFAGVVLTRNLGDPVSDVINNVETGDALGFEKENRLALRLTENSHQ